MKFYLRTDLPGTGKAALKIWATGILLFPVIWIAGGVICNQEGLAGYGLVVLAGVVFLSGLLSLPSAYLLWAFLSIFSDRFASRKTAMLWLFPLTAALTALPFIVFRWNGLRDRDIDFLFVIYLLSIWAGVLWAYFPWQICRN